MRPSFIRAIREVSAVRERGEGWISGVKTEVVVRSPGCGRSRVR